MNKTPIKAYQKEILRMLKYLWKQEVREMWKCIYTYIHVNAEMKGME